MPYRSRHGRTIGGRHPSLQYLPETRIQFGNTPLETNDEEEAKLKTLVEQGIRNQEEEELYDQLQARKEERQDKRTAPLTREIERFYENCNPIPLPPPLPKSSLWFRVQSPETYKFRDVREFYVACERGDLEVVAHWVGERRETLCQIGVQDGLACAARGDQIKICRYLLTEAGARLHGEVIRQACDNLSLSLFELCVEHGYHPNQKVPSSKGCFGTALRYCLGNDDITGFLLRNGADPNVAPFLQDNRTAFWSARSSPPMDRSSGLPLDIAVAECSVAVVRMLLEHGAEPKYSRPFCMLVRLHGGRLDQASEIAEEWRLIMDLLLHHGADINGTTYGGGTALSTAVFRKRWDIVRYLLEHGADPRVPKPCTGKTPLALAAEAAEVAWEDSDEMQKYISYLLSAISGSDAPEVEPPGGALDNPLIQSMGDVKRSERTKYGI